MKKKLTLTDVKIIGEGPQIRNAILQRYGSLEEFYEQHKVTNSYKTFVNYLSQEVIISDTFKCRITRIFDVDYPSLFVPKEKQIEGHVKNIYDNIYSYKEEEDQDTFDYLLDKCKRESMSRETAMMYRAKARNYYYINWMTRCREAYSFAIGTVPKEDINYRVFFHCELAYDLVRECIYDEAQDKFKHIEKLISLHKKQLSNATIHHYYYWRGILYRIKGSYTLAISFFNKALACADTNIQKLNAFSNLGYSNRLLKKYEKAHEYYKEALLWQDEADILATAAVYNNIACLYRVTKDYENAIINIEKTMEMSKNEDCLSSRLIFESTYVEIKTEMGDKKAYKSFFRLLLSAKGKKIYHQPHILIAIKGFIEYLDNKPCLEEYADIIIELKDSSRSDGFIDGLLKCIGCIYDKIRKIKKGVYNEKTK